MQKINCKNGPITVYKLSQFINHILILSCWSLSLILIWSTFEPSRGDFVVERGEGRGGHPLDRGQSHSPRRRWGMCFLPLILRHFAVNRSTSFLALFLRKMEKLSLKSKLHVLTQSFWGKKIFFSVQIRTNI